MKIFPFFLLFGLVDCGKYLFYFPMITKSIKITFMPVAKELVSRGHRVTVVMPFDEKEVPNGMEIITFSSHFEEFSKEVSKDALKVSYVFK